MPRMRHVNAQGTRMRRSRNGAVAREVVDNRLTLSEVRRDEVYRTDVEFTGTEVAGKAPRKGTAEREELDRTVCDMYARGLSHTAIACELDVYQAVVAKIVRQYGIVKGSKK